MRERGQRQGLLGRRRGWIGEREGEREDPVVVVEDGEGFEDKGGERRCWYDVDDMLEGKGTGSEKDQLGAVEEEGNSGGVSGKKGLEGKVKSLWVGFYF